MAALLFSCVFIPRISVGSIGGFYSIDLRTDDILVALLALLGGWLWAKGRVLPTFSFTEKAFLGFLIAAEISIFNGLWIKTIDKPLVSFLYLVKWFEYFLVFVLASGFARTRDNSRFFLKAFFFLGIAMAAYGWWEYFSPAAKAVYPNYYRLFERPPFQGDANHIGGLLVLWIGFVMGLFLKSPSRFWCGIFLAALIFAFFPLLWTYSRKSYFSLAGIFAFAFVFLSGRKRLVFVACVFVLLGLLFPTRLAERLLDLGEAFTSTDPFHSSVAGDWSMWNRALWNFDRFWLFGSGWGSRHRLFYESQYVLVLAETGLLGLLAFLVLCGALVRQWFSLRSYPERGEVRGTAAGWLLAFIGILIHNFSCVSWTVAKIAIPFWFLTAVTFRHLRGLKQDAG